MPTFFNFNKRKGVFMIPAGATKSPTPAPPSFSNTKSLAFDGVDEYIAAPIPGDVFGFATIRSFSFWVKTTSTSLQPLFSGIGPISSALFRYTNQLYYKTDNRLLWSYDSSPIYGGTICQAQTTDPIIINDGNWHHIVLYAPVDSSANRNNISNAKIYVDGVDLALTTQPGTAAIRGFQSTGETQIILGAGNQGGSTAQIYLDGNIDEFAYWDNYQLLSSEVTSIYNNGTPTDLSLLSTPPNKWYRMGDNSTYQTPQILMPENTNKDKVSNYSLTFDGVDDYVDCGTLPYFTTSQTSFSISFWFNLNTVGGMTFSIGNKIYFIVESTRIQCWNIGATTGRADTTAVNYTTGNWFHFACVYDGTGATDTDKFKVWINGVPNTLNFISSPPTSTTGTSLRTSIGNFYTGTTYCLDGKIDEVSVYTSTLTSEQITSIYNGGEPTTISGSTAYWKLGEQATFSTNWNIPDQVGSNDGTSANMTIQDRIGDAPNSLNNSVSFNMESTDIDNNVPT